MSIGQPINIFSTNVEGDVAAFHTDRSITGQEGVAFASGDEAAAAGSLPGDLAERLFAADGALASVFMTSNQVVVGRHGGWGGRSLLTATEIVTAFFIFYTDA